MFFKPLKTGGSNSKSFLLSPKNNIEEATKPSILNSSANTSFDINCFSFNGEEGSGYYAMIGSDGQANSLVKITDNQF